MTAPYADLPAEVRRIVNDLAAGPANLLDHKQTAITAAFDLGVIEATASWGGGHTLYGLRGRSAVTR